MVYSTLEGGLETFLQPDALAVPLRSSWADD